MITRTHDPLPHTALKGVFHEPSRMAIVTMLCGSEDGCTFAELKAQCGLTDGNLNRHLKALAEADAVRLLKTERRTRPCTIVFITDTGREHFLAYLRTLEQILRNTAETLSAKETIANQPFLWNIPQTT